MSLLPFFPTSMDSSLSRRTVLKATGAVLAAPVLSAARRGPTLPTATTPTITTLKSALVGLVDRNKIPAAGYVGAVPNVVIQARLADLWPAQGGVPVWRVIDAQITAAKAAGLRGARLRVTTGKDAPAWLAAQVSTYRVYQHTGPTPLSYNCPRWWDPAYTAAHLQFDALLAARYDSDPFVHETQVWAVGSTYSAETAIREFSDAGTVAAALAAGFSTALDLKHCYAFVDGMVRNWKTTRLITWVPMAWQTLINGKLYKDMAASQAYGQHVLTGQPGAVIGVDNADHVAYAQDPTYAMVKAYGCHRGDQTATWAKLGASPTNLLKTISDAAAAGVSSLELPAGYNNVPATTLLTTAAKIYQQQLHL